MQIVLIRFNQELLPLLEHTNVIAFFEHFGDLDLVLVVDFVPELVDLENHLQKVELLL